MTLKKLKILSQNLAILFLALSLTFSSLSGSKVTNHFHLKVVKSSASCCSDCGKVSCNCCSKREKNKAGNSGNCVCRLSNDMDEKSLSISENLKLPDYGSVQTVFVLLPYIFYEDLSLLNIKSSEIDYSSLQAARFSILLI